MSYDQKLAMLTEAVKPYVVFADTVQAEAYCSSWRLPMGDPVSKEVQKLAETLYLYRDCDGCRIGPLIMEIGNCDGTRLSALREAIRRCARSYLAEREDAHTRQLMAV